MRGILRNHPSGGRRQRPQARLFHRRLSGKATQRTQADSQAGSRAASAGAAWQQMNSAQFDPATRMDYAAQRVRAAGGPTDEASYTCACGYVFAAPVSTSVRCPHCGSMQDW